MTACGSTSPASPISTAAKTQLLDDLIARLSRFGLTARAGLADTLGAAHALARFAPSPALAPAGKAEARLAALPIEALRLAPETVLLLKRLGLRRIGELYRLPRSALQRRFRSAKGVEAVLTRLDQALGVRPEPRRPLVEPPALFVQRSWPDPLISAAQLEAETAILAQELCAHLSARGLGARRLCLSLYRADGSVAEVRAGLSAPSWMPEHMTALLGEKLAAIDAGFGIDVMVLAAVEAEKPGAQQGALAPRLQGGMRSDATQLVDRLANRLGPQRVRRIEPRASHIPERAEAHVTALAPAPDLAWPLPPGPVRPPLLLQRPEPIGVVAEVPEGPPASFVWRRVERRIVKAQGPAAHRPGMVGRDRGEEERHARLLPHRGRGRRRLLGVSRGPLRARRGAAALVPARAVRVAAWRKSPHRRAMPSCR